MLSTIEERRSKIDRNSVFDCHLSPVWRQMAIKFSVFNNFYLHSLIVLAFSIAAYPVCIHGINESLFHQGCAFVALVGHCPRKFVPAS